MHTHPWSLRGWLLAGALMATAWPGGVAAAQETGQAPPVNQDQLRRLEQRMAAQDARIAELEARLKESGADAGATPAAAPAPVVAAVVAAPEPPAPEPAPAEHEHTMALPGGPQLKISGFADFNLGFGSDANSLIFPLVPIGATAHNTFQFGEFDLFLSSRLSKQIAFVGELVIGADQSNYWGLDIERLQITYKPSRYFAISGGRYHTSIGYYNTAFHHGTWFQTATGRPFMYFFEDSGGPLPVHQIGVSTTGLLPRTGGLNLHWVAEVGNGRSSDPNGQPVQNLLSDKNHKAFNLAAFMKPQAIPGLQLGGSHYHDVMVPAGVPHVNQNIETVHIVFLNSSWESLNEVALVSDRSVGSSKTYHSPMTYAQISRKFGQYRPYFRYQYLNVPAADPVSIFTGRYQGPSVGLRMDFTEFVTLKAQYNRLYQRNVPAANGLDFQMAFAF